MPWGLKVEGRDSKARYPVFLLREAAWAACQELSMSSSIPVCILEDTGLTMILSCTSEMGGHAYACHSGSVQYLRGGRVAITYLGKGVQPLLLVICT